MAFIGNQPTAVPLTSSQLADGLITSAKIADGAIVNVDVNSTAAVAYSKLNLATSIVNADISTTAAITLNKISSNPTFRNGIINGDFAVAQRGTSFTSTGSANNNDSYTLDRFYILSDGNDVIDVTQETTTVPTNQLTAIALDVETINKKFGIAQIIEQKNCVGLIGNTVTLSFKAKVSSTTKLDNVKCAIVAWSGTADTVTSDIISAWGVEGTNPTLIANATYENTPANLSVTTNYATYQVSAAVDTASTKNIIVFIWSDVTDTTLGDFLFITDVQLEKGSAASDFEILPIDVDLARCRRYYAKIVTDAAYNAIGSGFNGTTTAAPAYIKYPESMRASPTVTQSGLAVHHNAFNVSAVTAINAADLGKDTALVQFAVASGLTVGQAMIITGNNNVNAYIDFSIEL